MELFLLDIWVILDPVSRPVISLLGQEPGQLPRECYSWQELTRQVPTFLKSWVQPINSPECKSKV